MILAARGIPPSVAITKIPVSLNRDVKDADDEQ